MNVLTGTRIDAAYDRKGPFVTVYLDATRATEQGAHEIELRWREVRAELARSGADDASLAAIADCIAADAHTPGRHGLVAVAAQGELCLADTYADPPARSWGSVAPLPHVMPFLRQRAAELPHIVVITDRTGADVLAVSSAGAVDAQTVTGEQQHPVHRTGRDDWSERHFQDRVENTWKSNARDVADAVARTVKHTGAQLVVVAGDVRARDMVVDDLAAALPQHVEVRKIDEGGRAAGSSQDALDRAVHDEVLRAAWRERHSVLEHLEGNLGRGEYAVAGAAEVANALRMAQVDTVVLSDDPSSTLSAWVGPEPHEFGMDDAEAEAIGAEPVEHDRYDAALVRAVVGTNAKLVITPGPHQFLPDGIGALLRYDLAS